MKKERESNLQELNTTTTEFRNEIQKGLDLKEKISNLEKKSIELNQKFENVRDELNRKVEEKEKLLQAQMKKNEQLRYNLKIRDETSEQVKNLKVTISTKEKHILEKDELIFKLNEQIKNKKIKMKKLKNEIKEAEDENKLIQEVFEQIKEDALNTQNSLQKQINVFQENETNLNEKIQNLISERDLMKNKLTTLRLKFYDLSRRENILQLKCQTLEKKNENLNCEFKKNSENLNKKN